MIRTLDSAIWEHRAQFLSDVRSYFRAERVLEVETPLLNAHGTVEPFLDPFQVTRTASAGTRNPAFLITSPEYNLKILLAELHRDLFQIAHCFRGGDSGDHHTEEFLMLEWYRLGFDEFALMADTTRLLEFLTAQPYSRRTAGTPVRHSMEDLFREHCDCGLAREELLQALERYRLVGARENATELRYDEIFFTLFLNRVEPRLDPSAPTYIYDYPPELAALAVVEGGRARRFELYWQGQELANGYYELRDGAEQARRFAQENELRRSLGKPEMATDPQLLSALSAGLPDCAGIALGLDRLFMALRGEPTLARVSPFLPSAEHE